MWSVRKRSPLRIPPFRTNTYEKSFSIYESRLWNSIPGNIMNSLSIMPFAQADATAIYPNSIINSFDVNAKT